MIFLLCILQHVYASSDFYPETKRRLDPVPEESGKFLEFPASFDVDAKGYFYLLDWGAKVIFRWDPEGRFHGIIGRPGNGPGEFRFTTRGGPQGNLGIVGNRLYVFDGAKKAVMVFNLEGVFLHSIILALPLGRTQSFYLTSAETFILHQNSFSKQAPTFELLLHNPRDGSQVPLLIQQDKSFALERNRGGKIRGVTIKGFRNELVSAYHRQRDELVVGYNGEPLISIYTEHGTRHKKIELPLIQKEVTEEDRKEFNEQGWIKKSQFISTKFPEKMPFFNRIQALGDRGYLIYNQSPFYGNIEGILVDPSGRLRGTLKMGCGENGGLLSSNGRILAVFNTNRGYLRLSEITVSKND